MYGSERSHVKGFGIPIEWSGTTRYFPSILLFPAFVRTSLDGFTVLEDMLWMLWIQSPKVECLEEEHKMPKEVLQSTYCLLGTLCKSEQDPP